MFSIEIKSSFEAIKPHLKQSYDKQNLTLAVISPKARFINFIWNDHSCKILYFSVKINGGNNNEITIFIFIVCKKRSFYEFSAKSLAQKV